MGSEPNQSLPEGHRTLAAIVFSDGVNFSGRMSRDEEHTLTLMQRDIGLMTRLCEQFEGRVLKTTGDGLLMYFSSAVQAVACALEIQEAIAAAAKTLPAADVLQHRIGIHLGDVFVSATDVMGDGVNIAARLQSEAEPGGICLSQVVYDVVKKRLAFKATYLGPRELKHIQEAVPIYQIVLAAQAKTNDASQPGQSVIDTLEALDRSLHQDSLHQNGANPAATTTAFKQALEKLVAAEIGPIAAVVVAQTLKQAHGCQDAIERLATHLPEPSRAAFRDAASRWLQMANATATPPPQVQASPTAIDPPPAIDASASASVLDPAFVKRCEQELTRVIGPIAAIIIKRTLAQQPLLSPPQLIEALAVHLPNPGTTTAFRQKLLPPS